jgi:V8-like Glu-specific endopeptidase
MRPSTISAPFLAWLSITSCTTGPVSTEDVGRATSAIVGEGARADVTHQAVVAVRTLGGSQCTGTIIRRNAAGDHVSVLTAAHCCRPGNPPRKIAVGADYADPQSAFPVSAFQQHPCYNPLSNDYDFCVLDVEDHGALNVTPVALASAPDGLAAGSAVTVVGYGSTPATNTIRRWADARLGEVSPLSIAIDQTEGKGGICFGDSGGPVLIQQGGADVVAGVISFGAPTSLCNVVGAAERVSFRGVRDEFLDKVLAGEKPNLDSILVRRESLTPGAVRDTYLATDEPGRNFGDAVGLLVGAPAGPDGARRALLRFDLSGLPAGATVLTARVGLHRETLSGPGTLSVHQILRDWDEHRETWDSFGLAGFDPRPLVTFGNATAVVNSTEEVWFDLTGLVERWASGEAENDGILLAEPTEAETQLLSSEIGRVGDRPWMSICYVPRK